MQAQANTRKGKAPIGGVPNAIDELLARMGGNIEREQGNSEDSEEEVPLQRIRGESQGIALRAHQEKCEQSPFTPFF